MCKPVSEQDDQESQRAAAPSNQEHDQSGVKNESYEATFDDALAEIKFGKFNYFIIVIAGTILGTVLFETLGISYVLPVTDCDLDLNTQQKGLLSAVGFIGVISSSHLWGFLADTKGRRRIIRPTLQIAFAFTLISSFLNSFWALLVFRFLSGFFISGGSATIYAYLGEFHVDKFRSKAIMGASVIFGIAALLMPTLAWLIINQNFQLYIPLFNVIYKPWRLYIVMCGLPGLIASLCLYIIPESPRYTLLYRGQEETLMILRKVYAMNTGKDGTTYPVSQIKKTEEFTVQRLNSSPNDNAVLNVFTSMWRQTSPLFKRCFLRQTIIGCLLQFITCLTANGMYMWFPDILDQIGTFRISNPSGKSSICEIVEMNKLKSQNLNTTDFHFNGEKCRESLDITAYQSSIYLEILYTISFAVIGSIVNIAGKKPILFVILVVTGSFSLALAYINDPLTCIILFIGVMLSGLSTVVVNAAMVDLFPTSLRAMAVCITLMVGRSGSVVGANVVGLLLDYNCQAAFLFSGFTLVFGGCLGFLLPNQQIIKEKTKENDNLSKTDNKDDTVMDA